MSQQSFALNLPAAATHSPSLGLAIARTIERGSILRIPRPKGVHIECLAGALWVTQDNDPRDIMLAPGEDCLLSGRARVLVQALEHSQLRLRGSRTGKWPGWTSV